MIKAVIVDDEKYARGILNNLLKNYFSKDIEIIGEAYDISSAQKIILSKNPDVVFLDIQMPGETGFDLLKKLNNIEFEVVFITAYDQYAIKAFQYSAFGYLLKPIKISELKKIILKLNKQIHMLKNQTNKRMKVLVENYDNDNKIKKIIISDISGFIVLNIEKIIFLKADRSYTDFYLIDNSKITSSKKLGDYEHLLNELGFLRIHHGTIINLKHVVKYIKGDGGTIKMINNHQLSLSRNKKHAFMRRFIS